MEKDPKQPEIPTTPKKKRGIPFVVGNKAAIAELRKAPTVTDDEDFRRMVIHVAKQGGMTWLRNLKKSEPDIFARLVAMSYKGEEPTSKDDKVFNINIGGLPISEAERKALQSEVQNETSGENKQQS